MINFKIIQVDITKANQKVIINDTTEPDITSIKGIFLFPNQSLNVRNYFGSTLRLLVGNREVLPKNFDCEIIADNGFKSWKSIKHNVDISVDKSSITGEYLDGGHAIYPYTMKIYLEVVKK